ncbi:hypothetical protein [Kordia sp.]|uniref:hypothetical protein n=1 Tax=Kordia sp. TaxID=1965332 RepID=UPI003D6B2801
MKKKTLKLHKIKIVKLTHHNNIKGGTQDTMTECLPCETLETLNPDGTCDDFTDDKKNGNNSIATFLSVLFGC